MAVTVDIPGIGLVEAQNAAQDSTLQEILKALKGKGSSVGAGGGAGGAGAGAGPAANNIQDLSDEASDAAEEVGLMGTAAAEAEQALQSLILGGITAGIGAIKNFGQELLFGGNRMSDLAGAIPLVGDTLGGLVGILDNQIDTFRNVAASGASFGNDMFEVSRVAGQAGMSLERFSNFVSENANTMALFGASTTEGARRFTVLSKGLRTGRIGEQLMSMGYEIDTINEGFIAYSEEMAKQGRLEGMSNAQLIEGSQNYLMEMDKLSKITGLNRKELERARSGQLDDARVRMHANSLEGTARENFLNNMTMINSTMPGMAVAFDDLRDGVAQTDEGIALVNAVGDKAYEVANALAEGVDPATLNNMLADMGPQLDEFFGGMSQAQLEALKTTNPALYAIASATGQINRLTRKSQEDIDSEQRRSEGLTRIFGGVEQAIEGFRGKIVDYFLSSPLFEQLTGIFDGMAGSGEVLDTLFQKMEPSLDKMMTEISEFVTAFMEDPKQALSDLGANIMEWLGDGLKSLFSSFLPSLDTLFIGALAGIATLIFAPVAAPFLAIGAALAAMFGWETIKGWIGDGWEMIKGAFEFISEKAGALWEYVQPAFNLISEVMGTIFDWIGTSFSNLWTMVQPIVGFISDTIGTMFGWIGSTFGWIWDKVRGPIEFIYNTLTGMFGWVGDTAGWIYDKIKALNPFSWFSSDDDEDEAEEQIAQRQTQETGVVAQRPNSADTSSPFSSGNVPTTPDTASMMASFSRDELTTIGDTMSTVGTQMADLSERLQNIANATGQKQTNDALTTLNTNMELVAELLTENNRLTKNTRDGINGQGDLMTG